MGYKFRHQITDPETGEPTEEVVDWDAETSSETFRKMNPGQRARFAKFFYDKLHSDENLDKPEEPVDYETFATETQSKLSGHAPETLGQKAGRVSMEAADRWLPSVFSKETRENVHAKARDIHEHAGDLAERAGRSGKVSDYMDAAAVAGVDFAAGVGENAMEYGTSILDVAGIPGAGKVVKGLTKVPGKIWSGAKAINAATDPSIDLGKAAKSGWEALKSKAEPIRSAGEELFGKKPWATGAEDLEKMSDVAADDAADRALIARIKSSKSPDEVFKSGAVPPSWMEKDFEAAWDFAHPNDPYHIWAGDKFGHQLVTRAEDMGEAAKGVPPWWTEADFNASASMRNAPAKRLQPGEVGYGEQLAKDELERRNRLALGQEPPAPAQKPAPAPQPEQMAIHEMPEIDAERARVKYIEGEIGKWQERGVKPLIGQEGALLSEYSDILAKKRANIARLESEAASKRGSLPPSSPEPGAQPTKPLLEQPARPGADAAEAVGSEIPSAPGSDIPLGSQMAEAKPAAIPKKVFTRTNTIPTEGAKKAAEAELRLQPKPVVPRPISQADIDAEKAFVAEMKANIHGEKINKEAPEKATNWFQRLAFKGKEKLLNRDAILEEFSPELHRVKRQSGDAAVGKWTQLQEKADDVIAKNIKNSDEGALFRKLYNLRSVGEIYQKTGKEYGLFGRNAKALEERMRLEMLNAGKADAWNRISTAVEEYADETAKSGLEFMRGYVDEKTLAEWAKKYRYYMSLKNFDDEAVKILHGKEGVLKHALPSEDEFAAGFMKARTGGEFVEMDPQLAYQKSLWQKIQAQHKRQLVDKAIDVSTKRLGDDLRREMELAGEEGIGVYEKADGTKHAMPNFLITYLQTADPEVTSMFAELAKAVNPISRRAYLDMNAKYYSTMGMRDIADYFLRAPGYLTPQTEYLAKKLGKMTGIEQDVPDLEYLYNPAPLYRGLLASLRENFPSKKLWGEADPIFKELERGGALQTGSIRHEMRMRQAQSAFPSETSGKIKKAVGMVWEDMGRIMKAWDDTIRIGNYLRNVPHDMRGLKNMGKIAKLESLPEGPVAKDVMNEIVRNSHIDFKMMGSGMMDLKVFNQFLNPAFQDKLQTWRYAKKQPISFGLTTSAFVSAAAYSYMKWLAKPEGRKLNPKDTARFIMLDTGIRSKEGGAYAMPVAMVPDSIQPAWIAVRNALDVLYEKSPEFRSVLKKNYASKTAKQALGSMANISGPVVAGVETMINHSFYLGGPIEGKYQDALSPGLRASKNVPNIFRLVGQKLNVSPDKMAYMTRGVLGTPGMAVAGWPDKALSGAVELPKEGTTAPIRPGESLARGIRGLPKAVGFVREQKFDSDYSRRSEFLAGPMSKDADVSQIIREYGKRFDQEKDATIRKEYLRKAVDAYKKYIDSLTPDERARVVSFESVFTRAAKDAAEAGAGAGNRTEKAWMRRFPSLMRKIDTEKEEEQAQ